MRRDPASVFKKRVLNKATRNRRFGNYAAEIIKTAGRLIANWDNRSVEGAILLIDSPKIAHTPWANGSQGSGGMIEYDRITHHRFKKHFKVHIKFITTRIIQEAGSNCSE